MADTTISQLTNLAPSANALIPFSQGGTTYATNLSSFNSNMFYLCVDCSGIPTTSMPNSNIDAGGTTNTLPINTIVTNKSNSLWYSAFKPLTNSIAVPYDGLYMISSKAEGYVPSAAWAIRAFQFWFEDALTGAVYEYFGHFNCAYAGYSNTHFCFLPYNTLFLKAGTNIRIKYNIFSNSGQANTALIQPIYNHSYLNIVQLS